MDKFLAASLLALGLFFLLLLLLPSAMQPKQAQIITSKAAISAEVADSEQLRVRGLMFRENLCSACGMLFVFSDSQPRSFWMKNTLLPLDMAFIDENFTVQEVATMQPCVSDPCPTHQSKLPAKYVLETNANSSSELGLAAGSKITVAYGK